MSDLAKTIVAMILTAGLSSVATTAKLGAEITNLTKAVDKLDVKIDKLDDRTRAVEMKQAGYLAANETRVKY